MNGNRVCKYPLGLLNSLIADNTFEIELSDSTTIMMMIYHNLNIMIMIVSR